MYAATRRNTRMAEPNVNSEKPRGLYLPQPPTLYSPTASRPLDSAPSAHNRRNHPHYQALPSTIVLLVLHSFTTKLVKNNSILVIHNHTEYTKFLIFDTPK